jgi:hypothetical protein
MSRTRVVTGVLAWSAALVAATTVGITAVNAIGSGIVGAGQRPLTQSEVDARLAASTPTTKPTTATTSSGPSTSTGPSATSETRAIPSQGGTVIARCVPGGVEIVSTTPAQGYQASSDHEVDDHPKVEFTAGDIKVEVRLRCVSGVVQPEIKVNG